MASVHKRSQLGRITFRATWRETGLNGKPRLRNKSFDRAADAKAFAAKMAAEREQRGIGDPARHTVAQFLPHWLASLGDRGELSPTTLAGYARCIKIATPWIGNIPLSKLSAADLDRAYGHMIKQGGRTRGRGSNKQARPLSARAVLNVHRSLHTAFEQARKWKFISENPARDARAPSPLRSKARALTIAEVKHLMDAAAADPETHAMVATALACGLRRSEIVGLGFDAVDFETGTLEVKRVGIAVDRHVALFDRAKTTTSARKLRIPQELVKLLRAQHVRVLEQALKWGREYQRDPLLVFPGPAGAPMAPLAVTRRMSKLLRKAGIKGAQPCHAWRHTAATLLLDGGANLKTVQARLGHSTPAITLALYVHPVDERDAEAAAHQQLGNNFGASAH
jgi:integrase